MEDIFVDAVEDEVEEPVKKKVKRQGPTLRSHSQVQKEVIPDWVPSDDEDKAGFLEDVDDDGFEPLPFVLPKGKKKSKAKKAKERV